MGKKGKNKQKISGSEKTARKTDKKLKTKQKKELSALGEDDIEKVISQIEREEAQRQKVVEKVIDQPSRRVNFTLTVHPVKDELIMFGGEFHDGKNTTVYGDMFFYNLTKKTWMVVKAPGAPPPRCGHQAVATPNGKGELWVFGGEFSSPSESQFYHYRDLWLYDMGEKRWTKVTTAGGPSARSGHRMVYGKRQLIVFGGFHDNLRDFRYHNDLHIFDMTSYSWCKVDLTGHIPAPRSGCIVLAIPDGKILVYGGYSKERVKKDVDKGQVHADMFILSPDKHDDKGSKWKSVQVKQSGISFSPRCSASAVLVQSGLAYMFGGVYDDEEDEEELHGTFFNDLIALDVEKHQWRAVNLVGNKEKTQQRKRKESASDDNEETSMEVSEPIKVLDDGVFTVTVGPSPTTSLVKSGKLEKTNVFAPSPRINPGLAVKSNILYLYGGLYEDGDRQYTLCDFYSLNLHKLTEWQTIIEDDLSSQLWLESDSSDSSESDDESDSSDNQMEITK